LSDTDVPHEPAVADFADIARYLDPDPVLIVISGPSGVGKDSVIQRMREQGHPFHFVVTATDRAPRPGETHGVDYYFVSTGEFKEMIAKDELFEHALVYDQYKGVPKAHARRAIESGIDVIMRLDVQGTTTVKRLIPEARTIFLVPSSMEVLITRLRNRSSDTEEQIQRRLRTAMGEMGYLDQFDYVVVNRQGHLDETIEQILAIISSIKCETGRGRIAI
jgi:guanylate kinase